MAKNIFDRFFKDKEEALDENSVTESFYDITAEEATANGSTKMMLLEPRAFSEATQIADYLKKRSTVVLNLKRVTKEQAKRIADFVSGTIYAIGGNMQNIGGGTFLCTPKNVNVEGKISNENDKTEKRDNDDLNIEW